MIDLTFKHTSGTREYSTLVTVDEYITILNSGMIDGKTLSYIKLWGHDYTDTPEKDYLVYDFELAKSGRPPFRKLSESHL